MYSFSLEHKEYRTYRKDVTISPSSAEKDSAFLPQSLVSSFPPLRLSRCSLSSCFSPLSFLLQVYACKRFVPFYSLQQSKYDKAGIT